MTLSARGANAPGMKKLVRFGVAMEQDLLERFDRIVEKRGYQNRSEALRDLVRRELDQDAWQHGKHTVATITLALFTDFGGSDEKSAQKPHLSAGVGPGSVVLQGSF